MRVQTWVATMVLAACSERAAPARVEAVGGANGRPVVAETVEVSPRLLRRFRPLRAPEPEPEALVSLGRMLYFDPRLSASGEVSCQSCHPLEKYGATPDAFSKGVRGQTGDRNAPTTYNAAGHFTQFWDGRARTLEEQAKGPILNPKEMGMPSPASVVETLEAIPGYVAMFATAFPREKPAVTYDHLADAIGAFERGLVTPSRWDRFLEGDRDALDSTETEGFKAFSNLGCMVCHTGELVGGSMHEKLGAVVAWPNQKDKGRARVTNSAADEMVFKVPSLRNVAMTPPYFHDASATTLDEAVRLMARHQLGVEATDDEVKSIVAWLGTLTGELPTAYIAAPTLPPPAHASRGAGR